MDQQRFDARERARELARQFGRHGDATGWFEQLYAEASGDEGRIPWADLEGHPLLVEWLERHHVRGAGRRALAVGCGLGEDAEALARAGFEVTGFDVSSTAIEWCHRRFPASPARYLAADLFRLPPEFARRFDFVYEGYTLQALPPDPRALGVQCIADCVAPRGELLIVTRGRSADEDRGELPWPLLREELTAFEACGLRERSFEDLPMSGPSDRPARHFRALYARDDT